MRINVGEEESATQTSSMAILELNGVTTENSTINTQLTDEAAQLLKDGELDLLLMVAGAASPRVNDPLITPGIRLLTVRHADAYIARLKNVSSHVLPEGVIGLAQNIPHEDTLLMPPRPPWSPALTSILTWRVCCWLFPTRCKVPVESWKNPGVSRSHVVGIPINAEVARYLENGPTGLELYLPLWLASRLNQLLYLLLPAALALHPVLRGLLALAGYFYWNRISRRYQYLRDIE